MIKNNASTNPNLKVRVQGLNWGQSDSSVKFGKLLAILDTNDVHHKWKGILQQTFKVWHRLEYKVKYICMGK